MKHTVFVTGGARGIGAATAACFARDGHRVAIGYVAHASEAERLCALLRETNPSVMAVRGDVSDADDVARMTGEITARFGGIGVLVNNAGVALPQKLLTDCTPEEIRRLLDVNVIGALLCARAVLPGMVARKRGVIINVSSVWGVVGGSCEVPYSASKAAVIGITRALAKEVAPSGIRVCCVAPGYVQTDMNAAFDEAAREDIRLGIPLETLGTAEDIASAIAFLASDQARFITGAVLPVDGGSSL